MGYLVISCNGCGSPRVAEQGRQSTQCPRCGKRLNLDKVLVHAETHSAEEARDAVGQINAQRAGGQLVREPMGPRGAATTDPLPEEEKEERTPEPRDDIDRALLQAREVTGQVMRARMAAQGLTEVLDAFTVDQWCQALSRLDVPEPRARELLEKLQHANAVAEPELGTYTYVG